MKIPFVIYCRAVGLYVLLTLPVLLSPETYFMSLIYVLVYGWLAWLLFTVLYLAIDHIVVDLALKLFCLFIAVVVAVAFAYQVLCMATFGESAWHTVFIFFPFAAVIAGWISLCISWEKIRRPRQSPEQARTNR
jgi:hypothetical protein